MKKLLLLPSLLLCTLMLMGQNKWSFGASLHAGFSGYSSYDRQDYPDPQFGDYSYTTQEKLQPSMGGGLWLERRLAKQWGIYVGLDYMQANSFSRDESINYTLAGASTFYSQNDVHIRQHQLQLPLEIHFYLGNTERSWRPFFSVGTQLQYLLGQINTTKNVFANGSQPVDEYTYADHMDLGADYVDQSRWQMGINAGVGVTGERLSLSIRRIWTKGKLGDNYYGCDCYCGLSINSYCPTSYYSGSSNAFRQLQQISLRLQYRLF